MNYVVTSGCTVTRLQSYDFFSTLSVGAEDLLQISALFTNSFHCQDGDFSPDAVGFADSLYFQHSLAEFLDSQRVTDENSEIADQHYFYRFDLEKPDDDI